MKQFIVTVKHDQGVTRFRVIAANEDAAKLQVMKAEGCPESAIIRVRKAIYNRIK